MAGTSGHEHHKFSLTEFVLIRVIRVRVHTLSDPRNPLAA
jgi:hypothetical protein